MPIFVNYGSIVGDIGSTKGQVHGLGLGSKVLTPGNVVHWVSLAPMDGNIATGHSSGKRQHEPFRIVKEVTPSSPAVFQAAVAGMTGNRVNPRLDINFYKTNKQGKLLPYFTITLTNAALAGIHPKPHPRKIGASELEEINFTFQKIDFKWLSGGTSAADDWTAQQ